MSVIEWIVLGLICWTLLGLVVGLFLGKVIKGPEVSIASTSRRPEMDSRSDVAA